MAALVCMVVRLRLMPRCSKIPACLPSINGNCDSDVAGRATVTSVGAGRVGAALAAGGAAGAAGADDADGAGAAGALQAMAAAQPVRSITPATCPRNRVSRRTPLPP